jgi:hypothetical protein
MSTALLHSALTPSRLDASHGADAPSSAPSETARGLVYPSMYPLPGSSRPPLASPPNVTLPAFISFAPGVYNAGGVNYFPNYQGHSTIYHPAGFIPPMNEASFQAPRYPFYAMPVGTATSTAALLSSEGAGHHEKSAQLMFQCPLPAQPDATPTQEQRQGQHHQQVAQEDTTVETPPQGPGEVDTEDDQTHEESHAALIELEVRLYSVHSYNHSHSPAKNTMVHSCSDNPQTACSGRGKICVDVLCAFVREYPHTLSPVQIAYLIATTSVPPQSNPGESTAGQTLQVDAKDPLPYQRGAASWETASSDSSTTASTSTLEHLSPNGSFLCPPNQLEAESSSMGASRSSTGKRQRSEDYPADRPKKQRREGCTDTVSLTVWYTFRHLILQPQQGDLEEHCEPCNSRILDGREKRRKKKKNSDGREFICIFCRILGTPCRR